MEFDEAMITEGIVRELGRDGQVFICSTIPAAFMKKPIGSARRFRGRGWLAHGKMPESRLER